MKKISLLLFVAIFSVIEITSCKKCIRCVATAQITDPITNTPYSKELNNQKFCGSKKLLDEEEKKYKEVWVQDTITTVVCKDEN